MAESYLFPKVCSAFAAVGSGLAAIVGAINGDNVTLPAIISSISAASYVAFDHLEEKEYANELNKNLAKIAHKLTLYFGAKEEKIDSLLALEEGFASLQE